MFDQESKEVIDTKQETIKNGKRETNVKSRKYHIEKLCKQKKMERKQNNEHTK